MKKLKRSTKNSLLKITAFVLFAAIVITNTVSLYANLYDEDASQEGSVSEDAEAGSGEPSENEGSPSDDIQIGELENDDQDSFDTYWEMPETSDEEESEEADMPDAASVPEEVTDGGEETDADSTVSPEVDADASPSMMSKADATASPSVTPGTTPKADASIGSSRYNISGTGLDEITVSFDTETLGEKETFGLVLSTDAENVSITGNRFSQSAGGNYRVEGLQKDASDITFGNLGGEYFTINAEGTEVTFIYSVSSEVQKIGAGLSCKVSVAASGGKSDEKASATPSIMPTGSPSTSPSVTPTGSPSTSPSVTPTGSPGISPSATPTGSPDATPSVSPEDTSDVRISINSGVDGVTGTGLKELTVSFDTEKLNDEDTFSVTLSTNAEGVSVSGSAFVQDGGSYRAEGLQKDASSITFKNLGDEDFSLHAEGAEVTFSYSASEEAEETEDGFAGSVTVRAESEEDEENTDKKELVLVNRTIAVVTDDGAFIKVSGLLPMGATVTAVPSNVEMEGKVVLAAYNITVWDADKKEYEITDTVSVTISNIGKLSGVSSDVIEIYHIGNESAEAEKVAEVGIQDGNKLSFDADGFSTYVATIDALAFGDGTINLLDIGTVTTNLEHTSTSDVISRNEKLKLTLYFTINPTDKTALIENPTMTYPLPQELTGFPAGTYILRTEDGTPVGTYAVGADNLLTIQFTNVEWVNKNSEFKGHIELSGELNQSFTEDVEYIEIKFEGEGNLKYRFTFEEGSASSSKTAWLDSNNGYIWFSLNITPNKMMDLTVTDTLVGGAGEIDWDTFELWNSATWQSQKITIAEENRTANGFKYTIESAKSNTNYTIRYGVKIDKAAYEAGKVSNAAEWSWEGMSDPGKKDQVEVNLKKNWLTKWYVSHKTEEGYTFEWTVTVNDQEPKAGFSVAGKVISDTLSGEHKYNSEITITGANGWSDTISFDQVDGKNGFSYTFPAEGTDGFQGDDVFTITYQTISTNDANYNNYYEVYNAVNYDGGEDTATSGGWHLVNNTSGTKQVAYISKSFQDADLANGILNWLINVDVEKGKVISGIEIKDTPQVNWNISTHKVDLNSVVITLADGTKLAKDADYTMEMADNGECTIKLKDKIGQSFQISLSTIFDMGEINNDDGSCEYKNWVSMSYCLEDGSWGGYDQSEAGYTIKKEYNIKKESNGFNETDGTIEWKVMINPKGEAYPDKIQYVLQDTLPANTSFVADSLKVWRYGLGYSSSDEITNQVGVSDIGGVLTITNLGNSDYIYEIIYKTRVDDNYYLDDNGNLKAGAIEFVNVAELQDTAGSTLGKVNAAQQITTAFLKKTANAPTSNNDAYIKYTIEVNEGAVDMLPDDDYLDLEDIIPEELYLALSTVAVTGTSDYSVSYDSASRKLTIHVPDATHCTVTYDAMIIGNAEQWYQINNKVYLKQNKEIYAENSNWYQKYDAKGTVTGTPGSITVQKIDGNGLTALPDTQFGLYKVPFKSDGGIKDIDLDNAIKVDEGITDSEGKLLFPTGNMGSIDANFLYYLIEEKAPLGYELSTQKYYFARLSTDGAHYQDLVEFLAVMAANHINYKQLSDSYGLIMSITNVKNSEARTELKVQKNYNEMFPEGGFGFTLTALGDAPMPDGAVGGSKTIQVTDSNIAETFGTIKYTSDGNYLYTIQEVIPDGAEEVADSNNKLKDGIIYDGRTYYVLVSVINGATTVFSSADGANYDALDTTIFEFTNEKQKTGSINVSKIVSGRNTEENFYFTLADSSGALVERNGSPVFEVKAGGTVEISGLLAGAYTLMETDANGRAVTENESFPYEVSYSDQNIVVSSGTVQEATITNQYKTGSIAVSKIVTGTTVNGIFYFTLTDESGNAVKNNNGLPAVYSVQANQTTTVSGIPFGTYTLTETDKNGNEVSADATFPYTVSYSQENGKVVISSSTEPAAITITNAYSAGGSVALSASKNLKNRTLQNQEFSFELRDADGNLLQTRKNDGNGNITFDSIQYSQADVEKSPIKYTISEVAGNDGNITYDTAIYEVEVTLTDDGNGNISTSAAYKKAGESVSSAVFTNTYNASGEANLEANKILTGHQLTAGQFSFVLKDSTGKALQTVQNDGSGHISFSPIQYTAEDIGKTFEYTISEVVPEEKAEGYTYDESEKHVTVTVTSSGNGTLAAEVMYDGSAEAPTFTNAYSAGGSAALGASKSLKNRTLQNEEFSFVLKDADGNVLDTKQNDGSGNITFDPIEYSQADVGKSPIKYTISEKAGDDENVTYDTSIYDVEVTLTDDGNGNISTSTVYKKAGESVSGAEFTNIYNASGEANLEANKILTGHQLTAGQFSFVLKDSTGKALQTVQNDGGGHISFSPIQYTAGDIGKTFEYTISEVVPEEKAEGYTYDESEKHVTVTVTSSGNGTLAAEVMYDGSAEAPTFTNAYSAGGSAALGASKSLKNRTLQNEEFSFVLKDAGGNVLQTKQNDGSGNITFDPIEYSQADVGKSPIKYTISEEAGDDENITYDKTIYDVEVTLTDDGNGNISTSTVYKKAGENVSGAAFTNIYSASGEVNLEADKKLTGRQITVGQFSFELKDAEGNVIDTAWNDAVGHINFAPIQYTAEDIGKTFEYTISEAVPEGSQETEGYTYDRTQKNVTVKVTNNGNGTLAAEVIYKEPAIFTNTYASNGSVRLEAQKIADNFELKANQFTFVLKDASGQELQRKNNISDGSIWFDVINYTQKDLEAGSQPVIYTIEEVIGTAAGYTYDRTIYTVEVTLTDQGDGTIQTSVVYKPDSNAEVVYDKAFFTNTYTAPGQAVLTATKKLDGRTLEDGQFSFELKDADNKVLQTAKNNLGGKVSFEPIEYTLSDVDQTFTYTINEVVSNKETGYTYDETVYTVEVTPVKNTDGTIGTTVVYKNGNDIVLDAEFTNKYEAEGEALIMAGKTLEGAVLTDQQFRFELKDADGRLIDTAANDKDGRVEFKAIQYDAGDAGKTFNYTINEVIEDKEGYEYDTTIHKVSVTVTDSGEGVLTTEVVYGEGEAANFVNKYTEKPKPTPEGTPSVSPTVSPDSNATATPEDYPESSPEQTPEATPETSPEATPDGTPGDPPGNTPDNPPDNPPGDTPDNPPGDTPDDEPGSTSNNQQVLGAKRAKIGAAEAAVLGARRGIDQAVLGRRRRPSTGDSMAIIIWIIIAAMSFGGVVTSTIMLTHNKKYGRRK